MCKDHYNIHMQNSTKLSDQNEKNIFTVNRRERMYLKQNLVSKKYHMILFLHTVMDRPKGWQVSSYKCLQQVTFKVVVVLQWWSQIFGCTWHQPGRIQHSYTRPSLYGQQYSMFNCVRVHHSKLYARYILNDIAIYINGYHTCDSYCVYNTEHKRVASE